MRYFVRFILWTLVALGLAGHAIGEYQCPEKRHLQQPTTAIISTRTFGK